MAGNETQTEKDNIHAVTKKEQVVGTKEEQLFYHDPRIEYKPLRRYIGPKFAFSDTSSTDWSDSTDSESDTEAMEEEATRVQKEKIRADTRVELLFCKDLAKSPSTDSRSVAEDLTKPSLKNLQSKSVVQDLSISVMVSTLFYRLSTRTFDNTHPIYFIQLKTDFFFKQVKQGAKSPEEGGAKDSKQARDMDLFTGNQDRKSE